MPLAMTTDDLNLFECSPLEVSIIGWLTTFPPYPRHTLWNDAIPVAVNGISLYGLAMYFLPIEEVRSCVLFRAGVPQRGQAGRGLSRWMGIFRGIRCTCCTGWCRLGFCDVFNNFVCLIQVYNIEKVTHRGE